MLPFFHKLKNEIKLVPAFLYKSNNTTRKEYHSLSFRYCTLNIKAHYYGISNNSLCNEYLSRIKVCQEDRFIVYFDITY